VPVWALLTPRAEYRGIYGLIIWWIIVLAIYYIIYFIYKKIRT
jgi:hypothetical protein